MAFNKASSVKTQYVCSNCGASSAKWTGKCNSCNQWNTFSEEVVAKKSVSQSILKSSLKVSKPINEIVSNSEARITLVENELNILFGGGIVRGSLILFAGEPGIGKSTLMLQLALENSALKILYISGEESETQIKLRSERLNLNNQNCYIFSETCVELLSAEFDRINPDIIIIDSIQTIYSNNIDALPGSVSQIRETASALMSIAKEKNISIFLIGHITKDGSIAGPKLLEHLVDVVLQFEGDKNNSLRTIRSYKNRFGNTNELVIYEMTSAGLVENTNPSDLLITKFDADRTGIAIGCCVEGSRPIMLEIQALVSTAVYGTPQRNSNGFDYKRLNMLLAILESRCGFRLAMKDVFLNIAGGFRTEDPAIDLAVVCAILSSNEDIPINPKICFAGEVGLSGEIRPSQKIDLKINEAAKIGFDKIIVSKYHSKFSKNNGIEICAVSNLTELLSITFG